MQTLQRFITAQSPVMDAVLAELRAGTKRTHWMWFVFPQLEQLGRSTTAKYYGLASKDEASAYLADPVLGARLRACTEAVLTHHDKTAHAIFGSPDDMKFRSCMTLFDIVAPDEPLFRRALEQFFGGAGDPLTLAICGRGAAP